MLDKTKGTHEDIIVDTPKNGFRKTFDSYYFGLDDEIKTDLTGMEKVKLVMTTLISLWIRHIKKCKEETAIYLPIDFSDQYIGCFQIKKKGAELLISYGYSSKEGFSISPSNPRNFFTATNDFKLNPNFKGFTVRKNELIEALEDNMQTLKS